jgi:hypothetical protein
MGGACRTGAQREERKMFSRPTAGRAALAVSVVALFAALDGFAWAAQIIDGSSIKNESITASKLADNAVVSRTIAGAGVTTAKLAGGAVNSAKIASNAVTAAKLAGASVTSAKLANDAVTTQKIKEANVTAAQLAKGAVTSPKIAANAVAAAAIASNAVITAKIAAGAVTRGKLATDARVPQLIMRTNAVTVEDGQIFTGVASCAAGERLMGGAASWQTPAADLLLSSSAPVPTGTSGQLPTQWSATFVNVAGSNLASQARTWAICAQTS